MGTAVLTAAAGLLFSAAHGSIHAVFVKEVFAGTVGNPQAQFVELQMYGGGQTVSQNKSVVVYTKTGATAGTFTFTSNATNGTNQATYLVATTQAQAEFNVTADALMTSAVIDPTGGKVCFTGSTDCVVWGAYTGSASGTPFSPAEGIIPGASAERKTDGGTNATLLDAGDDTGNHEVDFKFNGPSPKNNPGASGIYCCTAGASQSQYEATESAGSVTIDVTRSSPVGTLSVDYATADGTAIAGSDYTATSGTLTFADTESTKSFSVSILSDPEEYHEIFLVKLRNLSSGVYSTVEPKVRIFGELSPTVPGAPQGLTATRTANTTIRLDWLPPVTDGGKPVTAYKLYRSTSPTATKTLRTNLGNVLTFNDGGLANGTTYYYQVSAVNELGEGAKSNEASATTATVAPGAPQSPAASHGPDVGQITVTWQPPVTTGGAAIASYEIHRRGATGNSTLLATVDANTLSYVDGTCSLSARVVCFYKIRAKNTVVATYGTFSAEVFSPTTKVL